MWDFLLNHTPLLYLTQSLWRDEAFSILVAERPIPTFIGKLNFEPPVYYVLLHFWMKLFGNSEIAARSLSLLGFTLATIVVIYWSEEVFKKHWLSLFLPIFFFLNPMLLYYAFEVRAYGWVMFFATLSLFAYSTKRWKLLAIANILAFYTHSYAIFLPLIEGLHFLFSEGRKRNFWNIRHLITHAFMKAQTITFLAIAPWMVIIINEMRKLQSSWYFPVDLQLVRSVVGNMFVGYDGTPGGRWKETAVLSLILLLCFTFALLRSKEKRTTSFLFSMIFLPLIFVIGISFFKPLFVNRYLIYVTIAQVVLLGFFLKTIQKPLMQKLVAGVLLLFVLMVNLYAPDKKAKADIRTTIQVANGMRGKHDVLFVTSPLIFFEAVYYTPDREHVFLYNPAHNPFPWYVGEMAFSSSHMAYELPEYPQRAVVVGEDRSITMIYRQAVVTPLGVATK